MDLLFIIIGVMSMAYSFRAKVNMQFELIGMCFLAIGLLLNISSYVWSVEKTDTYEVTQLESIVFSKPTTIIETYTEYPFSFRQDKVVYTTVDK